MTVLTDDDLARLQREATERAAENWDPTEAALIVGRLPRLPRSAGVTEIDLAALQREAEVRARAFWDPDEAIEFKGQPSKITGALVRAIEDATEAMTGGPNKTPFLGAAYLSEYLKSPYWQAVRTRALQRAGGCCQRCRRQSRRLDVHHLTYRNLGQERESELMVLCRECHEAEHGRTW
jgi:hypothetical protein